MLHDTTYRPIPFSTRIGILFGGFKSQFGWAFFGFGMIFFWAFAMNADLTNYSHENIITTEGIAIRWQSTDASENEVPVYKNYFSFTDEEGIEHEGVSFATGYAVTTGEVLTIEYPEGKPELARIKGMRRKMFGAFVLFVVIFPVVGLIFLLLGFKRSFRALRLLKYGELAKGILISKERTNTKINNRVVYRMIFQFKDEQGREHTVSERTPLPRILQDQKEERLLYLRRKPSKAIMLDNLPGAASIDEDGRVLTYPARNVFLLSIFPLTTIIGHGIYVLNTYLI